MECVGTNWEFYFYISGVLAFHTTALIEFTCTPFTLDTGFFAVPDSLCCPGDGTLRLEVMP